MTKRKPKTSHWHDVDDEDTYDYQYLATWDNPIVLHLQAQLDAWSRTPDGHSHTILCRRDGVVTDYYFVGYRMYRVLYSPTALLFCAVVTDLSIGLLNGPHWYSSFERSDGALFNYATFTLTTLHGLRWSKFCQLVKQTIVDVAPVDDDQDQDVHVWTQEQLTNMFQDIQSSMVTCARMEWCTRNNPLLVYLPRVLCNLVGEYLI